MCKMIQASTRCSGNCSSSQWVRLCCWSSGRLEQLRLLQAKGRVLTWPTALVRTAADQRHPPNRKPADCDDSLSHIPAAAEIGTTEPTARDATLTTNAQAWKAIHLVPSLGRKREWLSQTLIFDMSQQEAATEDGRSKSRVTRWRACTDTRLDCSVCRTEMICKPIQTTHTSELAFVIGGRFFKSSKVATKDTHCHHRGAVCNIKACDSNWKG